MRAKAIATNFPAVRGHEGVHYQTWNKQLHRHNETLGAKDKVLALWSFWCKRTRLISARLHCEKGLGLVPSSSVGMTESVMHAQRDRFGIRVHMPLQVGRIYFFFAEGRKLEINKASGIICTWFRALMRRLFSRCVTDSLVAWYSNSRIYTIPDFKQHFVPILAMGSALFQTYVWRRCRLADYDDRSDDGMANEGAVLVNYNRCCEPIWHEVILCVKVS